jgi:hypothetical protein
MISKKLYAEGFAGFHIYDCAVRNKNILSFVLCETLSEENDEEPKKRLMNYFLGKKEEIGGGQYTGFVMPKLAASQKPSDQAVMVALNGDVAVQGAGVSAMELPITLGSSGSMYTSVHALASIEGHVYAAGPWRSVARRIGSNQWESMVDRGSSMPLPKPDKYGSTDTGFDAIGGFNANDIYCAGGKGDVWRYNGKRWQQCPMPTNLLMETLCCAGDEYVYIGMAGGSVLKGRENSWKIIHTDRMTLPFTDMVWFEGRVWCTSDHGLWTIENDKLIKADVNAEISVCSGHLSTADGVMLLAGVNGAAIYDGRKWEVVIKNLNY